MSPQPKTGTPNLYADGDQRNYSRDSIRNEQRHHLLNAEGYMKKDRHRAMDEMRMEDTQAQIEERYKKDPLYGASMHLREPSRGAKQDAAILAEEAEIIRKKQGKTDSLAGKKFEHKPAREHRIEEEE
ncbi:hypothetical protein HD806DRAFT_481641 [Xylariaceae sp. AK1471]|nr:hypothetical protein HD806DRAFT_481641 [Xylariaceae sp. AK1471]